MNHSNFLRVFALAACMVMPLQATKEKAHAFDHLDPMMHDAAKTKTAPKTSEKYVATEAETVAASRKAAALLGLRLSGGSLLVLAGRRVLSSYQKGRPGPVAFALRTKEGYFAAAAVFGCITSTAVYKTNSDRLKALQKNREKLPTTTSVPAASEQKPTDNDKEKDAAAATTKVDTTKQPPLS